MITYYLGRKYVRADLPMAQSNVSPQRYRRSYGADDDTLVRWAEQSLTRPNSFAYFGGHDLFRTWGMIPIAQTRDSDALEESNYQRILEDMRTAHPDEDMGYHLLEWVADFRSSHWAVGWMEQILVRVLYDPDEDITPPNITSAFREVMGIADWLSTEYPIYDESDYSEREHEETTEAFDAAWDDMLRHWDEEDDGPEPTDEEKDLAWGSLDICTPDDPDEDKIREFMDDKRLADTLAQYENPDQPPLFDAG
jgi:hypothetical protein